MELVYEAGRLLAAATRGDGATGEDVTANAVTLKSIPLVLSGDEAPTYVAVRGEAYVRKADFLAYNARLADEGEEPFANPRNFCAGSLRLPGSFPSTRRWQSAWATETWKTCLGTCFLSHKSKRSFVTWRKKEKRVPASFATAFSMA